MERKPSCLLAEARLLQPVTEGYGAKQVLDEKWLWDLCRDALRGRGGWEGADPLSPDSPKPFQSNRWGSLGKRLRFARWCCPLARWEAALFSSQAPADSWLTVRLDTIECSISKNIWLGPSSAEVTSKILSEQLNKSSKAMWMPHLSRVYCLPETASVCSQN